MHEAEHAPGTPATVTGTYQLLDIFGSPTDHRVHLARGEPLPDAPRGHTWRLEREPMEE